MIPVTAKDVERFSGKYTSPAADACWLWQGGKSTAGYGVFRMRDKTFLAPRVSYTIAHGQIPAGMLIRHTCDTPACVNPTHLLLGTDADNAMDKVRRGRVPDMRGERNPRARLTAVEVVAVRDLRQEGLTLAQIARLFDIGVTAISRIASRRTWGCIA